MRHTDKLSYAKVVTEGVTSVTIREEQLNHHRAMSIACGGESFLFE
jgi:hypothetical protein